MDNQSLKKLALVIEKVNYLFKSIKANRHSSNELEVQLLKQYVIELYDRVVEMEQSTGANGTPTPSLESIAAATGALGLSTDLEMPAIPEPIAEVVPPPPPPVVVEEVVPPPPVPEPEPVSIPEPEPIPVPEPVIEYVPPVVEEAPAVVENAFDAARDRVNEMQAEANNIVNDPPPVRTQILDDLIVREEPIAPVTPPPAPSPAPVYDDADATVAMNVNDMLSRQSQTPSGNGSTGGGGDAFDISFNSRFAYVNQLFGGDDKAYEKAIHDLSQSEGYIEALTYINLNLRHDYKWQDGDATVKEFLDMIKGRFLG